MIDMSEGPYCNVVFNLRNRWCHLSYLRYNGSSSIKNKNASTKLPNRLLKVKHQKHPREVQIQFGLLHGATSHMYEIMAN